MVAYEVINLNTSLLSPLLLFSLSHTFACLLFQNVDLSIHHRRKSFASRIWCSLGIQSSKKRTAQHNVKQIFCQSGGRRDTYWHPSCSRRLAVWDRGLATPADLSAPRLILQLWFPKWAEVQTKLLHLLHYRWHCNWFSGNLEIFSVTTWSGQQTPKLAWRKLLPTKGTSQDRAMKSYYSLWRHVVAAIPAQQEVAQKPQIKQRL